MLSNTFRGKYFTITKCYAPKHKLQRSIVKHGGKVLDSIERKVSYLITTEDSVNTSEMTIFAIENGHIRIINEHFVEACIKNRNILDIYDHKYSIYCLDWKACREQVQEYLENEKRVHSETIKLSASLTLAGGVFVVCGRLKKSKTEIQTLIIQNGGNIVDSVTKSATHVISSEDSLYSAKVQAGIAKRIPIVKEEFIEACIQSKTLLDLATKANSKFCIVAANEATRAQNINGNITQKMTQMRGQGNIFQDAVFTISGKLTSKNILTIEILQRGGIIKDTVTGKTTHVISDGITNAKVKTAKEKGIPIVRESFIRACVTEGQLLNLSLIKNKNLFIITPKERKAAAKQPQKPSEKNLHKRKHTPQGQRHNKKVKKPAARKEKTMQINITEGIRGIYITDDEDGSCVVRTVGIQVGCKLKPGDIIQKFNGYPQKNCGSRLALTLGLVPEGVTHHLEIKRCK